MINEQVGACLATNRHNVDLAQECFFFGALLGRSTLLCLSCIHNRYEKCLHRCLWLHNGCSNSHSSCLSRSPDSRGTLSGHTQYRWRYSLSIQPVTEFETLAEQLVDNLR